MAGEITAAIERWKAGERHSAKVTLTCTGDASDGSFPATNINTLVKALGYDIRGMKISEVKAAPGATAPTDATDVEITDENGIDILGARGTNLIDATSKTYIVPGPASQHQPVLVTGDLTIAITGNSVHSAITTIVLNLID
jgi:hypothetical protein